MLTNNFLPHNKKGQRLIPQNNQNGRTQPVNSERRTPGVQFLSFLCTKPSNELHVAGSCLRTIPQLVEKFPAFYGTRKFITAFTKFRCLYLDSTQAISLASGHFSSVLHTKNLFAFLFSLINATCPTHHILLDIVTPVVYGEVYRP